MLTATLHFFRIPSRCSLDLIPSTSNSSPLSPGSDGCAINSHERRKTLISPLYTSRRRSPFCPVHGPAIFPDYSSTSQSLVDNAPRSTVSPKTSKILSITSGTSEDIPSIHSTSLDRPLRHYLSVHWAIKLSGVLGMGHGISRRWCVAKLGKGL
jgi:hypothetical protein